MKKILALVYILLLVVFAGCASQTKRPEMRSGFADVNGLKMYYEIHGHQAGTPLVLIHGGGSSIDVTWGVIIPYLAKDRTVIAIDEQAHGKSGDRNGPVSFEQTADDVAALIRSLKFEKVDVMGFSNGATNALQLTLRHPELVRKLVHISSFTKRSGAPAWFWQFINKATFADMPQSLKDTYLKVNPGQEAGLRNMHDKDQARIRSFKDINDKLIQKIKSPTLFVQGDRDVLTLEHGVALTTLVKDARLMVLPGGHGDFLGEVSSTQAPSRVPEYTAGLLSEFLGKP